MIQTFPTPAQGDPYITVIPAKAGIRGWGSAATNPTHFHHVCSPQEELGNRRLSTGRCADLALRTPAQATSTGTDCRGRCPLCPWPYTLPWPSGLRPSLPSTPRTGQSRQAPYLDWAHLPASASERGNRLVCGVEASDAAAYAQPPKPRRWGIDHSSAAVRPIWRHEPRTVQGGRQDRPGSNPSQIALCLSPGDYHQKRVWREKELDPKRALYAGWRP